jgi:multidrug efflux pump subunit AcrA (membrane-fusion protein)
MKNHIFKISVIAALLAAGFIAVFNIPDAVESFLPVVETVSLTETEYNQTVSGTGIITRTSQDWFVTISVGESDIRRVETGQTAALSGAAFDDGIYTAVVYQIADVAVPQLSHHITETVVEVVLKIDNPDYVRINGESGTSGESGGILRPGYSARADIKTDEMQLIHIIPYHVILQDDIGEFVFILSGNSVLRRDIITGIELAGGAQVLAGLREEDQIIANPHSLAENALVNPLITEEAQT